MSAYDEEEYGLSEDGTVSRHMHIEVLPWLSKLPNNLLASAGRHLQKKFLLFYGFRVVLLF